MCLISLGIAVYVTCSSNMQNTKTEIDLLVSMQGDLQDGVLNSNPRNEHSGKI